METFVQGAFSGSPTNLPMVPIGRRAGCPKSSSPRPFHLLFLRERGKKERGWLACHAGLCSMQSWKASEEAVLQPRQQQDACNGLGAVPSASCSGELCGLLP